MWSSEALTGFATGPYTTAEPKPKDLQLGKDCTLDPNRLQDCTFPGVSTIYTLTKAVVAFSLKMRTTRMLPAGSRIEVMENGQLTGLIVVRFEGESYSAYAADVESCSAKARNE